MYEPRCSPSSFHFSLVAIGTARTCSSSSAFSQSTRVVHPRKLVSDYFLISFIAFECSGLGELTLMIYSGNSKWIAAFCIALIHEIGRYRLKGECHVGSCRFVDCHGLFPPKCVYIFVELHIDLGAGAPIVVAAERFVSDTMSYNFCC